MQLRKIVGWTLGALSLLVTLLLVALAIAARTAQRPAGLGVANGRLAPCPASPNCVSSQATDPEHAMQPIPYRLPTAQARTLLLAIIAAMPRATVEQATPTYIAAVFRSPTFQFPDDVEFAFDESAHVIHFRSAARLGRDDAGVNRTRMATIAQAFAAQAPQNAQP